MKVVCINTIGYRPGAFTLNKVYETETFERTESVCYTTIRGDENTEYEWNIARNDFMPLEEWRSKQIGKLGI